MATSNSRATLIKLTEALIALETEYQVKRSAIHAEMAILLGGGDGIGIRLNRVIAHWCETWEERHHETVAFDRKAHTAFLKAKLLVLPDEQVMMKMTNFLLCDDPPELVRSRHPFAWFRKTFDTWRGLPQHNGVDPSAETRDRLQGLRGE